MLQLGSNACSQRPFFQGDVEDMGARSAVQWTHVNYIMVCATFVLNLLACVVLAAGGVNMKGLHLVYALFNLVIYSIVGRAAQAVFFS